MAIALQLFERSIAQTNFPSLCSCFVLQWGITSSLAILRAVAWKIYARPAAAICFGRASWLSLAC